jgi:hypothetical protein
LATTQRGRPSSAWHRRAQAELGEGGAPAALHLAHHQGHQGFVRVKGRPVALHASGHGGNAGVGHPQGVLPAAVGRADGVALQQPGGQKVDLDGVQAGPAGRAVQLAQPAHMRARQGGGWG